MNICGIDPGYSVSGPGGIVFLVDGRIRLAIGMPLSPLTSSRHNKKHLRQCDLYQVTHILNTQAPDLVCIEAQSTRARQHAGTTFKSGVHFGSLIGVCCALDLPYELVQPVEWKRDLGLIHTDKATAALKATELMPDAARFWPRRLDHGIAEAALIAWWRFHHADRHARRPRAIPAVADGGPGANQRGQRHLADDPSDRQPN